MEFRKIGNTDLYLPSLGMGCWPYGGGKYWGAQSQHDVNETVRMAFDHDVNYFDTAEGYNDGHSESSLGTAIKGLPRDKLIVGTMITASNTSHDTLIAHCEASLKRLQTDYIDLYMIHWPITAPSIAHFTSEKILPSVEEAFTALKKLQRQGKIRYVGVNNFGVAPLKEAMATGVSIAVNQLPYSLLSRAIEYEILPYCLQHGVSVIGYMTLLQGVLTDTYPSLEDIPVLQRRTRHFDSRKNKEIRHKGNGAENETNAALNAIRSIAKNHNLSTSDIAIKWAIAQQGNLCALVGSRNTKELKQNIKASSQTLPGDVIDELTAVTEDLKETLGPSFDYYEAPENDRTV
jgi:aryl-alcohol dehydrogenase-like predicted oxidoreductase